jgi:hypothetical protein
MRALDDYETVGVVMSEGRVGMIQVTKLEENEDGSANLEIETDAEATRFLVEEGLVSVLKKAIDAENKEYALSPELQAGDDSEQETSSV